MCEKDDLRFGQQQLQGKPAYDYISENQMMHNKHATLTHASSFTEKSRSAFMIENYILCELLVPIQIL